MSFRVIYDPRATGVGRNRTFLRRAAHPALLHAYVPAGGPRNLQRHTPCPTMTHPCHSEGRPPRPSACLRACGRPEESPTHHNGDSSRRREGVGVQGRPGGDRGRNDMAYRCVCDGDSSRRRKGVGVQGWPGGDRGRNDMDVRCVRRRFPLSPRRGWAFTGCQAAAVGMTWMFGVCNGDSSCRRHHNAGVRATGRSPLQAGITRLTNCKITVNHV